MAEQEIANPGESESLSEKIHLGAFYGCINSTNTQAKEGKLD